MKLMLNEIYDQIFSYLKNILTGYFTIDLDRISKNIYFEIRYSVI